MTVSRRYFALALGSAVAVLTAFGIISTSLAENNKGVTADEVRALQQKFQAERAGAQKSGSAAKFSAELFKQVDVLAKQGETELAAGRLNEARDAYRAARWYLPVLPPDLPEHVVRVFGSLKLRHGGEIPSLAYSPDGSKLATASIDGTVKIWDTATGRELRTYRGHNGQVQAVAFSPVKGDKLLVASGGADKTIHIWNANTGAAIRKLTDLQGMVATVAFSPDGKSIASAGTDSVLYVHDATDGKLKFKNSIHTFVIRSVAYSPDGQWLATAGDDRMVRLWKANAAGTAVRSVPAGQASLYQVAFSPSGDHFAACGADNVIKIYDMNGNEPQVLKGHTKAVTCLAYSKDGKLLASGSNDRSVRLWDIASGQSLRSLRGHGEEITAVGISPDGGQLVSAGKDQALRLWDLDPVERVRDFTGQRGPVWSAAFSPDTSRIAAGGADKMVRLWEFNAAGQGSATPVQALTGHQAAVTAVTYSADGKSI
ncbi:MAG TPA: WD40 repeat domain-containing protein, partial [Gemmataceae bacterium]|nr:WD40 repeat domain-containing protein [Gemmataceae bacterium]